MQVNTQNTQNSLRQNYAAPSPSLLQIKASAGSGKTYDLTRRFLLRLEGAQEKSSTSVCTLASSGVTNWGDILAITFTNAAATEMKERVIIALKKLALGQEAPEGVRMSSSRAQQWVNHILRHYGSLNIRTIDSLLHIIARAAALDLNLPPEFEPVFATDEALAPILDMLMEEAWHNNSIVCDLLAAICHSLVYRRRNKGFLLKDKLLTHLRPLLDNTLQHKYDQLSHPQEMENTLNLWRQELMQAANHLHQCTACSSLLWNKTINIPDGLARLMQGGAPYDQTWWEKEATAKRWQKASLSECLKKDSPQPDDQAEAAYHAVVDKLTRLNTKGRFLLQGLAHAPFALLAQALADSFSLQVHADGKVPATLIPQMASSILAHDHAAPEIICRMGSRLTHFLIDEFQDTSREQWRVLQPLVVQALAQGGSLTWVGDVKQAIYSWRGGDARLFDGIATLPELSNIAGKLQQERLDTNWRSRTNIITTNNTLFSQLENPENAASILRLCLPQDAPEDILSAQGASAQGITQAFAHTKQKFSPKTSMEGGYVHIQAVEAETSAELDGCVQQALLEKMQQIGARRPWGDIAILVRSNNRASLVATWLMEANIPVFTENSLLLKEHPLIEQLVAFLRFLQNPSDNIACFTCMAGTLVEGLPQKYDDGFSRQNLTNLAASGNPHQALHHKVRQYFPQTWAQLFSPFFLQAGMMSPYDTVQEWLIHINAMQRFAEDAPFIRRFLEVLYASESQGYATLPAFLEYWDARGGEEKVPMSEGINAVRIMTMHKSKGLEYPVVILPWMNFPLKEDATQPRPPLLVEVDGLRVLAQLSKEMGASYYQAIANRVQENLHLLYVAWTRARDELHCFHTATASMHRAGNFVPAIDWLLQHAHMAPPYSAGSPMHCDKKTPTETQDAATQIPSADHAAPTPPYSEEKNIEQEWRPMDWLPSLKVYRNPLGALMPPSEQEEQSITSRTGTLRGSLMHAALEHIRLTGQPELDATAAVRHALRTSSDPIPNIPHLEEQLIKGVAWFAALPDAQIWKKYGIPEQSLLTAQGKERRVDLLLETADGYLVLEFKTGDATKAHIQQVREYMSLLKQMDARPVRGLLLYLDKRLCRSVTEKDFSALEKTPQACGITCTLYKEWA